MPNFVDKELNPYPISAQQLLMKFGETKVKLLYMPDIMGGILIAIREDDKDGRPLFRMDMDGMLIFDGALTPGDSMNCGKKGQIRIKTEEGILNPTRQEEWDGMEARFNE